MATKRNLARNNPRLEVDLKEVFGRTIPRSEDLKQAIGQSLIDKIVERTKSGKDKDGKKFNKYSKSYIQSEKFKAFGKSAGDVNLTLTGDMLGFMDIIKIEGNKLTIGWDDDEESSKAFQNITRPTNKGKGKPRDFFDLRPSELKAVKSEFKDAIDEIANRRGPSDSFIASVIERLGDGENEG